MKYRPFDCFHVLPDSSGQMGTVGDAHFVAMQQRPSRLDARAGAPDASVCWQRCPLCHGPIGSMSRSSTNTTFSLRSCPIISRLM